VALPPCIANRIQLASYQMMCSLARTISRI
jgi:hypothetical protein